MQNNLFTLTNINKIFNDGTVALNDITLNIKEGVTAIIGPSGSGKSSLLRLLNLLEKPTSGNILYNNNSILTKDFNLLKHRSEVGMVFQNFNLFPHLTVLENINIAQIEVLNKDFDNATNNSNNLLKMVGLLDKANSYPNMLSGGQKQRVAIARALAINPKVILFDEPTSALDPEMIKEVLEVIKTLKNNGMNMIIVTHDINVAKRIANNVIVLEDGKFIEQSDNETIFNNPTNERTKEFLNNILY